MCAVDVCSAVCMCYEYVCSVVCMYVCSAVYVCVYSAVCVYDCSLVVHVCVQSCGALCVVWYTYGALCYSGLCTWCIVVQSGKYLVHMYSVVHVCSVVCAWCM